MPVPNAPVPALDWFTPVKNVNWNATSKSFWRVLAPIPNADGRSPVEIVFAVSFVGAPAVADLIAPE